MRVMGVVCLVVASLCGCQSQSTVMVTQAASQPPAPPAPPRFLPPLPHPHISPCGSPAGSGPYEPLRKPIRSESVPMPPRALAEHVRGCAGVRFRIAPDGTPRDITLVAEYPVAYGFGEAGRKAVAGTAWAARDDLAWHYIVINMNPKGS